jgi:hypothetical protein
MSPTPAAAASAQPTWEEVLASFEATADAAESLLEPTAEPVDLAGPVEYDPWQLALPPLPQDLHERARALQVRHEQRAARLQRASGALRRQEQFTRATADAHAGARAGRSLLVDQQV